METLTLAVGVALVLAAANVPQPTEHQHQPWGRRQPGQSLVAVPVLLAVLAT